MLNAIILIYECYNTMNALLHGLCEEGSMVMAVQLFEEIVEEEHLCNDVLCNYD